ncbi:MAG: hypothetical protein ACE5IF_01330 [Candidatus Bathyarchaeia archaeon]
MCGRMEIKKPTAIASIMLGLIILTFFSIKLILTKLSLPPWSIQTEGKYVAYGLEVYKFLFFTLPLGVSLLLAGYLVYPPMFRRFYATIRPLSALLAIGGFGVTALVVCAAIINYLPLVNIPIFILTSVAGLSPFWVMAILATLVFEKSKP